MLRLGGSVILLGPVRRLVPGGVAASFFAEQELVAVEVGVVVVCA
jgi:hypothetical protein